MNERDVLMVTNSPFVTKLHETYTGTQTLYFLLEAALGGELYATYNKKGLHGSKKHARFYTAGVVFAFDHLHERRIIYRDLKPENLLLTSSGHVKLTDMGLAKFVIGKTFTTCGTPDYFAPELITSQAYSQGVDWWTFGILLYELMSGHPPFEASAPMQIYAKVMQGVKSVVFPATFKGPLEDIVKRLLKKEPSERLPMKSGGSKNIKKHNWYASFDWASMEAMALPPPYVPEVKNATDMTNFSASKDDLPPQAEYHDDGSSWDKNFATA